MTSSRDFTAADTSPSRTPRVFVAGRPSGAAGGGAREVTSPGFIALEAAPSPALEKIREAARTAGFAEGWAQGSRQAGERAAAERAAEREAADALTRAYRAQRSDALRRGESALRSAADTLRQTQDPTVAALADTVLELACDLAGAVLDRELSLVTSPVLDAVQRALRPLDDQLPITVRVHPDDLSTLTGDGLKAPTGAADAGLVSDARQVSYVADRTLQPGEAIARQGQTDVDARLRASVARALEALLGSSAVSATEVPEQAA